MLTSPGIAADVAGPGVIIQSDFGSGDHGNFEFVAPLYRSDGSMELWHFWHDNSDVNLPWQRGQRIAANVAGPGVIIQSDFGSGDHSNFEVVVPLALRSSTSSMTIPMSPFLGNGARTSPIPAGVGGA